MCLEETIQRILSHDSCICCDMSSLHKVMDIRPSLDCLLLGANSVLILKRPFFFVGLKKISFSLEAITISSFIRSQFSGGDMRAAGQSVFRRCFKDNRSFGAHCLLHESGPGCHRLLLALLMGDLVLWSFPCYQITAWSSGKFLRQVSMFPFPLFLETPLFSGEEGLNGSF